jgi:hypothetical protein
MDQERRLLAIEVLYLRADFESLNRPVSASRSLVYLRTQKGACVLYLRADFESIMPLPTCLKGIKQASNASLQCRMTVLFFVTSGVRL